jgi:hypothetical protein
VYSGHNYNMEVRWRVLTTAMLERQDSHIKRIVAAQAEMVDSMSLQTKNHPYRHGAVNATQWQCRHPPKAHQPGNNQHCQTLKCRRCGVYLDYQSRQMHRMPRAIRNRHGGLRALNLNMPSQARSSRTTTNSSELNLQATREAADVPIRDNMSDLEEENSGTWDVVHTTPARTRVGLEERVAGYVANSMEAVMQQQQQAFMATQAALVQSLADQNQQLQRQAQQSMVEMQGQMQTQMNQAIQWFANQTGNQSTTQGDSSEPP